MEEYAVVVGYVVLVGEVEPVISITQREYRNLLKARLRLECMEAMGVDSWSCYDDAVNLYVKELARGRIDG